jgi:hypothetical protein
MRREENAGIVFGCTKMMIAEVIMRIPRRPMAAAVVVACVMAIAIPSAPAEAPRPGQAGRLFDRVLLVLLENQDYDIAVSDPYFQQLMAQGASFSDAHAVAHPSYPNYIALVAGDTFDITDDTPRDLSWPSIADLLETRGLTWKNYAERYPGHCSAISRRGQYDRKHVPFINFTAIRSSSKRCRNIVAASQFAGDRAAQAVPNYAFFSPDRDNDGHDTNLVHASTWLRGFLEPLLGDAAFMSRTLIIVTFDESASDNGNQIYTVFLGPMVKKRHVEPQTINHYNVLRTIEDNFGLGTLGRQDAQHAPITTVWERSRTPP